MDPELDRSFGINTEGRVYPAQYGAGGASSSAQGGYDADVDLGGMDDL